jgi:hypothetical protein
MKQVNLWGKLIPHRQTIVFIDLFLQSAKSVILTLHQAHRISAPDRIPKGIWSFAVALG